MEYIWQNHHALILVAIVAITFACQCNAQSPSPPTTTSPRQLDSLLQDYAYRAFDNHPHTGKIYDAALPANLTGIKVAALRLRSGSLRVRGFMSYKEFEIPLGVAVQPYVTRIAFVYHNLGNWSSFYYPLPGFTYLTPLLGLLAYSAANLSATDLNELDVVASKSPISINFGDVKPVPSGLTAKCVWFDLDGLPEFRDLVSDGVCSTYRQGHFSIVVNSSGLAPPPALSPGPGSVPAPSGKNGRKLRTWKVVVAVVGGLIGLVLLALLVAWISRHRENKKVAEMERRAELGESLQMARVGATQAPVASGTRTQPVLESEHVV